MLAGAAIGFVQPAGTLAGPSMARDESGPLQQMAQAGPASGPSGTAASRKRTMDERAAHLARIGGVWEGHYVCQQGRTGVKLTVEADDPNDVTASFRFYAVPDNPRVPDGEILYGLRYNPAARIIELRAIRWIQQPRGYDSIPIHVRLSANGRRLQGTVRNRACGEIVLDRVAGPEAVAARQQRQEQTAPQSRNPGRDVQAPSPRSAAARDRQWYGSLTCTRGREGEVEFSLTEPMAGGHYQLRAVANFPNSMMQGTVERAYIGERTPGSADDITFVVQKSVRSGIGQPNLGNFQFNERTGEGRFSTGDCQRLSVQAESPGAARRTATMPPPPDRGSFFAAKGAREQCEAAIKWTDRLKAEYPDRNFYRSTRAGDDWRKIKLFGDDDFVPVFGRPFDVLSLHERKEIDSIVSGECYRNPFTKDRMEPYRSAADRTLDDDPDRQLTSDGYSSTVFAVRTMRQLRNQVRAALRELAAGRSGGVPFDKMAQSASTAKASIKSGQNALWPSEAAALTAQVDEILATAAIAAANAAVGELERATDPGAGLSLARTANDLLKHLPAAEKAAVSDRIAELRKQFADRIAAPMLSSAGNAPTSIEGVRQISGIIANELASFGNLDSALKKPIEERLERERSARLAKLLEGRLSELKAQPAGLEGLKLGAAWLRSFDADFSSLSALSDVKAAKAAFLVDRADRLKATVREFEARVRSRPAEADGLAEEYLSLPDDRKHPVSLDYAFVVETARTMAAR